MLDKKLQICGGQRVPINYCREWEVIYSTYLFGGNQGFLGGDGGLDAEIQVAYFATLCVSRLILSPFRQEVYTVASALCVLNLLKWLLFTLCSCRYMFREGLFCRDRC